ncbi:hypothetical protein HZB97_02800 [Candidatus Gottesmanbacteria bacterium]|nr:hypothetical protein [Candidatus Gottesmanbacteria bacterium]MBI5465382.1 hypothetical protein [Candidatus Gottesmanbacteria bacterium]
MPILAFHYKKTGAVARKAVGELFPSAQVPGAKSLKQVFTQWKKRGLEPVEVSREATIQRIEITHDPLKRGYGFAAGHLTRSFGKC